MISLKILLLLPLISILIISIFPEKNPILIKKLSLHLTFFIFYYSLFFWIFFNKNLVCFQFIWSCSWFSINNIQILIGIDGLSLFFILLTTFLIPICLFSSWKNTFNFKKYIIIFISLEWLLLILFTILDIFIFFVFFEAVLIPMFFLVGIWSSSRRKVVANFYFFLFTILGSIFMLFALFFIFNITKTTNLLSLFNFNFSEIDQKILWFLFFCSFAVKIPIIPFHLWLPLMHVESPTSGSVLLAAVLLKLGFYGLIRFSFSLFPQGTYFFFPLVITICLISIFYSGLTILRQIDLKRIIAFSSIVHMNYALLGSFSLIFEALIGSFLIMISHAIIASGLFLSIGILYDRYHSRLMYYYTGLVTIMPLFCSFLFIFIISNFGLPGTSSFIGEFLIIVGIVPKNFFVAILAGCSLLINTSFSLWLFNRICYGDLNISNLNLFLDLTFREFVLLSIFVILIILFGFFPNLLINTISTSLLFYV